MITVPGLGMVATGDDEGCVKLWDLRQQAVVMEFSDHTDFISDLAVVPHKKTLLATRLVLFLRTTEVEIRVGIVTPSLPPSGDGTLSVMNWKRKTRKDSIPLEDEPLSVVVMKDNTTVVCGTQEGTLAMYKWGAWIDINDRMLGHPRSVDALVKVSEDIVLTGSSDGLIRAVSIHPNRLLGVVGEHEGFPIERMRLSGDGVFLGSCSHDKTIKFWNLTGLFDEEEDEAGEAAAAMQAAMQAAEAGEEEEEEEGEGWEDEEEEEGDEEEEASWGEIMGEMAAGSGGGGRRGPGGAGGGFFAGL